MFPVVLFTLFIWIVIAVSKSVQGKPQEIEKTFNSTMNGIAITGCLMWIVILAVFYWLFLR